MKKYYIKLKNTLYFVPVIYGLVFSLLAWVIISLDQGIVSRNVPELFLSTRAIGVQIFSVEVGSILTMLTLSFSITMVVLTIYGSQLSPRTLQDFLEKPVTQNIMGYFIGTLVFSIYALFSMKPNQYDTLVISPLVGVVLMVVAVFVFIYFIHYISKSIQITLYIQRLTKETDETIEKIHKDIEDDPLISNEKLENYLEILERESYPIKVKKSGFIQYYDELKLLELAKEKDVIIWCEKLVGEHVLEEDSIIKLFGGETVEGFEELVDEIISYVYIGNEPNLYHDYGVGSRKLVEIAVRALSPGVNDPNTAVFCIEKIGYLLRKIAKGQEAKVYINDQGQVKVVVQGLTFEKLLFDHFYQIKFYGIGDLVVLDAVLGALITIAKDNGYYVNKAIGKFSGYLLDEISLDQYHEMEKNYIFERFYQLAILTNTVEFLREAFQENPSS